MGAKMTRLHACLTAVSVIVCGGTIAPAIEQPKCLHGQEETPDQASRRREALNFARYVNSEESLSFRSSHQYIAITQMAPSRSVPRGFELKFAADGSGYVFSIVDQEDACQFGYFSNDSGRIYKGDATQ